MRSLDSPGWAPLPESGKGHLETLFKNLQPIGVGTWFTRARGTFAYAESQATSARTTKHTSSELILCSD